MLTPLSRATDGERGIVGTEVEPKETTSGLDKWASEAADKISASFEDDKSEIKPASLDDGISAAMAVGEEDDDDRKSFARSREYRAELRARYGKEVDLGALVEKFIRQEDDFRKDPVGAADRLAGEYLQRPYAARYNKPETKKNLSDLPQGQRLGAILDDALDGAEAADFKMTAKQRALIREKFNGMPFDEVLKIVTAADRDLHDDPIGAAARIAASYGVPVTQSQHQNVEYQGRVNQVADGLGHLYKSGQLPRLAELSGHIGQVLQNPQFQHTPDLENNLRRAYRIAEIQAGERAATDSLAKAKAAQGVRSSGTMPNYSVSSDSGSKLDRIIGSALG
jgi:hypothetical protein